MAILFKHALNDKHHIGTARIVFIEYDGHWTLKRPGQQSRLETGNLLAIFQCDYVFSDQVEAADVAVQIDPQTRPIEACRHLFNMRRFSCSVQPLNQYAAVVFETSQQRKRNGRIEVVPRINGRREFRRFSQCMHLAQKTLGLETECLAHINAPRSHGRRICVHFVSLVRLHSAAHVLIVASLRAILFRFPLQFFGKPGRTIPDFVRTERCSSLMHRA